VLLTYAFTLSNLARSIVVSLGIYERDRAISDADRKTNDERLNHAVDFLRRASGVFLYISGEVLSKWEENQAQRSSDSNSHKLPELTRDVNNALAKYVKPLSL
jgi:hypothetical protein